MNHRDQATLDLLSAVESNEPQTQRSLAVRIGVALGMTNGLLKRAVNKGLIKISQAPAKRYMYYVTPRGFREKSRLVAEYLSSSLVFIREGKEQFNAEFERARNDGRRRIALFGTEELTDIAILAANEANQDIHVLIRLGSNTEMQGLLNISSDLDVIERDGIDGVVITDSVDPQAAYDLLRGIVDDDQIYVVPLLRIRCQGSGRQVKP